MESFLTHVSAVIIMVGFIRFCFGEEQCAKSVVLAIVAGGLCQSMVMFYLVLWFSVPELFLAGLVGWVLGSWLTGD